MQLTPQDLAFQAEVRDFIATHMTADIRRAGQLMTSVYGDHDLSLQWQHILAGRGWAAPGWPVAYGGCDWSVTRHYIFNAELAAAGAPPVSPMGIQMCGPALIGHGSAAQKAFFLPKILSGEHFWCQGYSEPGAGSDLASLQMDARRDGDHFICNGAKIWTTHANVANWIFCLVRTARLAKPQQGITFLLIDMTSPGIDVQPIIASTGEHIQNQIFFTDVAVPVANVVGEIDHGWTVAKFLMEFERGGAAYAPQLLAKLDQIARFATSAGAPLAAEPLFAAKLADARARSLALQAYEWQLMERLSAGGAPGVESSVVKIIGTELQQTITALLLEASGDYGLAFQPQATCPGGPVAFYHNPADAPVLGPQLAALAPLRYLNERAGTIYAGSNEIQRNILAKAALGL